MTIKDLEITTLKLTLQEADFYAKHLSFYIEKYKINNNKI
jgi:hypothetical protein